MPVPGYRQRIASGAISRRGPQGASTGEAIGAGVAALGQTLDTAAQNNDQVQSQIEASNERIAKEEQRRWRSAQSATALGRYAELQIRRDEAIDGLQKASNPGGVGHREAVTAYLDKENEEFLGSLPDDPEIRERFTPLLADSRLRTVLTEVNWERTKAAQFEQANVETFVQSGENRILSANKPFDAGTFEEVLDGVDAHFALSDMDATVKAVAIPKIKAKLGQAAIDKLLLDGNWQGAKTLVESGLLEQAGVILDNGTVLKRIDVEERRSAAEQETKIRQARADLGQGINEFQARVGDGIPVPDSDFESAIARAKAAGLPEVEIYRLNKARVQNRVAAISRSFVPADYDREIKTLQTKIGAAGDKAADDDVTALNYLVSRRGAVVAQFESDPQAFRARNGGNVTQINWSDPASVRAYASEVQSTEAQTGVRSVVLGPVYTKELSQMAGGPIAERAEALRRVSLFPIDMRRRVAGQVGLGDAKFTALSTLGAKVQAGALQGAEARKADKTLVKEAELRPLFNRFWGKSLGGLGAGDQEAAYQNALDIYAYIARTTPSEAHPDTFRAAMNMSIGATKRSDGVWRGGRGDWNGGIYVLPEDHSESEFERKIAQPLTDTMRATNGKAVNPDGSSLKIDEVRSSLIPTRVGGTIYRWTMANGSEVKNERGETFLFDVAKIPIGPRLSVKEKLPPRVQGAAF